MADHDNPIVSLKIPGRHIPETSLPDLFMSGERSAATRSESSFLPAGLVRVTQAFDLSQRSRDVVGGQETTIALRADQVVVLELPDGLTLITSAGNLAETLQRLDPRAHQAGAWRLDALRERGVATRGWVGDLAGSLISRVFVLDMGTDAIIDEAKAQALEWARAWLGDAAQEKLRQYTEIGVSWLGTRALMWAIETKLKGEPGLYRWASTAGEPSALIRPGEPRLAEEAKEGSLLVFIHGTASNTVGSFGDLQAVHHDDWNALSASFGNRIYAFEHRTLSESPIDNALALATTLPRGARLNLVTHSRGGLVGDFLCLADFDDHLIDGFRRQQGEVAAANPDQRQKLRQELEQAHQEHRARLRELRGVLRDRGLQIERYVRVASPSRGTRLASSNFDVFMSALLALIGMVPYLAGNPLYAAFKRVVLEIARHRTNPALVPGIEAMLPDSPVGRFLAMAPTRPGMQLAVIAGDIESGSLLKRLGVLFTDVVFFDMVNNDLVVDTDSMYAGLARPGQTQFRFEQGATVSHFNYFGNQSSRTALRQWLTTPNLTGIDAFALLPDVSREQAITLASERQDDLAFVRSRGGDEAAANLPVVMLLPGIMGSHLWLKTRQDRIWFDPLDIIGGGLDKIRADVPEVEAEKLFDMFYGDLCRHLRDTHEVERFAYDWRLSLQQTALQLQTRLRQVLARTTVPPRPVRILAHSMGGLVVRALIAQDPGLWDEIMARPGARLVMLGTPNQGSYLMVETLLGKSDMIRKLARLDATHTLQQVLDIVAEFPGALQLLPKPGFADAGGAQESDYFVEAVWNTFKQRNTDFWFGDGIAGQPKTAALTAGRWLWDQDRQATPTLPAPHQDKVMYIYGQAELTPCGVQDDGLRLKMLGTPEGDGWVTWASGTINGIGSFYTMPVEHGALADSEEHFAALVELLAEGQTGRLVSGKLQLREARLSQPISYDAGPVPYPSPEEVARSLLGARPRQRARVQPAPLLQVSCLAMDLRFVTRPVLVGHYEHDTISGAEAMIDRDIVAHELSMRHHLGLYAGAPGSTTVVLLTHNDAERLRHNYRGAVVVGLGVYGDLTAAALTQAVRVGTLRYLMQLVDNRSSEDEGPIDATLSSLLLGHNSTTNISVEDSVTALVHGVLTANQQFAEMMRRPVRVTSLEIVELYLDTAISAAKALARVAERVNANTGRGARRVQAAPELRQGTGWRQRLDAVQGPDYWPRLIVTDADRHDDGYAPAASQTPGTGASGESRIVIAKCLKFSYLGQRARSETEIQQRQPGLVETLVKRSITARAYSEDFSRALFQLLVPHAFKDAARQLEHLVLVLDGYTANLPWELMLVDDKPLAVKTAMIRQLQSPRYRTRVRQTYDTLAYVVGNPSTAGFYDVFSGQPQDAPNTLDALDGAEQEARTVIALLKQHQYEVVEAIGGDQTALDVISKLYRRPYRLLHIAAHGVYDHTTRDGDARSGVVLSDGTLITAAEISAMEVVPDLVFLNCCHLGKTDRGPLEFNRLAYSVARELIEIGVRAVVAAGWAVDDRAANLFADIFYTELFKNRPFGEVVFEARVRTYEAFPNSNTWGAYQAYGDPGFVINPQRDPSHTGSGSTKAFVVPEELLDGLQQLQAETAARLPSPQQARQLADHVEGLLKACPNGAQWQTLPQVSFALGQVYAELGSAYFDKARTYYLHAIVLEDTREKVPIRAIEQLANLEARQGEERLDAPLLMSAVDRLRALIGLTAAIPTPAPPPPAAVSGHHTASDRNAERAALLGRIYTQLAAMRARQLQGDPASADLPNTFRQALADSIAWHRSAEGHAQRESLKPCLVLQRLALQAVHDFGEVSPDAEAKTLLQTCAQLARETYRTAASFRSAVTPADAVLTSHLLEGSLGADGPSGNAALESVQKAYAEALAHVPGTPRQRHAVVKHLCLLKLFYEVQSILKAPHKDSAERIARRLGQIAEQLQPGAGTQTMPPAM